VEPQRSLAELVPPSVLSRRLSAPPRRGVPFPTLSENTLVLSDAATLGHLDGALCLSVRLGDTYPSSMMQVQARMYLYRWAERPGPEAEAHAYEARTPAPGQWTRLMKGPWSGNTSVVSGAIQKLFSTCALDCGGAYTQRGAPAYTWGPAMRCSSGAHADGLPVYRPVSWHEGGCGREGGRRRAHGRPAGPRAPPARARARGRRGARAGYMFSQTLTIP
jgi:hypothetical protein